MDARCLPSEEEPTGADVFRSWEIAGTGSREWATTAGEQAGVGALVERQDDAGAAVEKQDGVEQHPATSDRSF